MVTFGAGLIGWYVASEMLNLSDGSFSKGGAAVKRSALRGELCRLVMGAVATTLEPVLAALYR